MKRLVAWFKKKSVQREIREWSQSIAVALVLMCLIRVFVVQVFKIPSGSMRPTLCEGDKLFVNKFVYRFEEPKRGDIVVFKYPQDPKKDFIKRLAAFGGETIEIRDGRVYVNHEPLPLEGPFKNFYYYNHDPYGGPYENARVPEGSVYVLGDNSANSQDSRYWGFVPRKNVIGKAVFRWWPPRRFGAIE